MSEPEKQSPVPYKYGEKLNNNDPGKDYYLCPEPGCGRPARVMCRCPKGDGQCDQGHSWHLSDDNVVCKGPATHG